ncbi:MAG: hypothetical protein F6J98_07095, partial [Moorea sp. SIO4G2]|nr:hypothetical protein [Moorena sp. SIO4G2]
EFLVFGNREQDPDSRFPIPYSLLPTPYSRFPIPDSLFPLFKMATTVAAIAKF